MGATKTDHFTDRQNQLAVILKAMGHPARVAILEFLLKTETCICGDIVDELPLAQPTVSQHLKALKDAGLIVGNIEGNAICYCINPAVFEQFRAVFYPLVDACCTQNTRQCC
jgi:ArsR family transcriptional regulator, arsenate/arsenite/antimonite-responsive transcriptional repressor